MSLIPSLSSLLKLKKIMHDLFYVLSDSCGENVKKWKPSAYNWSGPQGHSVEKWISARFIWNHHSLNICSKYFIVFIIVEFCHHHISSRYICSQSTVNGRFWFSPILNNRSSFSQSCLCCLHVQLVGVCAPWINRTCFRMLLFRIECAASRINKLFAFTLSLVCSQNTTKNTTHLVATYYSFT